MTNSENHPNITSREGLSFRLTTQVDDDEPIYVSGTFNNWNLADRRYQLKRTSPKNYHLEIPAGAEIKFPIEYKFVRGGWDEVELDENGNLTDNRILTKPVSEVKVYVPLFARKEKTYDSDLLPKIVIISNHFEIPQLIKTRRITALLPHDYYETDKRYPVLYLQDGQNLFDDYAPYGNWGVDKKLAEMSGKGMGDIIIIAIDHGKEERMVEFTPNHSTGKFTRKEGKQYIRFLADTLKPHIDKNFRTLPDVKNTGIGGSSMGGLISIYAGLVYPEVYSRLMIFSPSLWVMPNMYFGGIQLVQDFDTRIYLYAGGKESQNMIPNAKKFKDMVTKKGRDNTQIDFHLSLDPDGVHSEYHWGQEFPKAIEWLFFR